MLRLEFLGLPKGRKQKSSKSHLVGKVIGGVIGSKFVRYDVFGEGVVISQKVEKEGMIGKVTISDDTRRLLNSIQDIGEQYTTSEHKDIYISSVERNVELYTIERNYSSSVSDSFIDNN